MPRKVAVTGGREFDNYRLVDATLSSIHTGGELSRPLKRIALLVHGGAKGVDSIADAWAVLNCVQTCVFRVTERMWRIVGARSGPMRNRLMLETTRPDLLVAFPGGRGTADCVKTARSLGIEVLEVSG